MGKDRCTFRKPPNIGAGASARCLNVVYKRTLCKLHSGSRLPGSRIKTKDLGIYVGGLFKEEQELYDDVPTGNLKHEIKIAKLQLRRLLIEQMKFSSSPEDINNMIASNLSMKDVLIQNGKFITTSGLPVDLLSSLAEKIPISDGGVQVIPAALVEAGIDLKRPDHLADIERMLKLVALLERVHFEMMGGTSDDPELVARQIFDALAEIEADARGENNGSD